MLSKHSLIGIGVEDVYAQHQVGCDLLHHHLPSLWLHYRSVFWLYRKKILMERLQELLQLERSVFRENQDIQVVEWLEHFLLFIFGIIAANRQVGFELS